MAGAGANKVDLEGKPCFLVLLKHTAIFTHRAHTLAKRRRILRSVLIGEAGIVRGMVNLLHAEAFIRQEGASHSYPLPEGEGGRGDA